MKREGFQHGGAVRVNRNKLLRIADGEAAARVGAYARAPSKPTNASRSTGKCKRPRCAGCHDHPVTKARDKAKGAHKLRACDVALNHRLVSWRVVDGNCAAAGTGIPDYKGASASAVLAYLAGGNSWHEEDDDDGAADLESTPRGLSDLYDLIVGLHADAPAPDGKEADLVAPADNIAAVGDIDDAIEEQDADGDEEEEEDMGFCMVGITIALEFSDGEEDWIVVEEIPST